ncbi:MAG: enamine deaminase RidA [Alphaproteobacteria bacterium]|nr:enamine deaminase RidA [Alphaproteobacteria bacterium]|tara:strand:+ start:781 stop:1134 length:354 start_codon:yes stop_codon:yes gene_type:complete
MIRYFNPDTMAPPFSTYSLGAEIMQNARTVYVAGQVGVRPDGSVPADVDSQAEQMFLNIRELLRGADMDLEDPVSTRTYLLTREHIPHLVAVRSRLLGDIQPPGTLLIVAGLGQPDW